MGIGIIIFLAVLQGLTEFLPVSSSGHLVLAQDRFGLVDPDTNLQVAIALHAGSLLAILAYFFRDFVSLFTARRMEIAYLVLGSIPAAAIGFLCYDELKQAFASPLTVAILLMVNGVFLWTAEACAREPGDLKPWWKALGIGVAQVAGMFPGISRSGSTIGAGLLLGVRGRDAVRFSFFLGAIAIFGATLKEISDGKVGEVGLPILLGVGVSFGISLLAIRIVALLTERRRLRWFAGYCIGVGVISLVWILVR